MESLKLPELFNMLIKTYEIPLPIKTSATNSSQEKIRMEIYETKDTIVVRAEIPGVSKSDIKVSISPQKVLSLSFDKIDTIQSSPTFRDIFFGKYSRSIKLPDVTDIKLQPLTQLVDGILTMTFNKQYVEEENINIVL